MYDIIFLQETWLLPTELDYLGQIDKNVCAKGSSSAIMNQCILTGRPYGGLGILWRKSLDMNCTPVTYPDESNLMAVKLTFTGTELIFINVYTPYCLSDHYDDFVAYLSKLDS